MKMRRQDIYYLAAFFVAYLIFFHDLVFSDLSLCYRDIVRYYQPAHFFATDCLQRGVIPFWNPYVFCGMPFLANLQHALFYPFSLLHYLFPFDLGFKHLFLVHYLVGGLGIYLLLRKIGLAALSCLAGAIVFTFSGYLVSVVNLLTTLSSVVWLSFVLLFFICAVERHWLWSVLVGVVLALEFHSGQPEILYFSGIILAAYAIYAWFYNLARPARILGLLTLGIFTSIVLVLPELTALKEMIGLSVREKGVDFRIATYWSFHPLELITIFLHTFSWDYIGSSHWFRQTWLKNFYFGVLPLAMMVFSYILRPQRRFTRFFLCLGSFSLLLALGKYTPIYNYLFQYFPGFNLIRYPVKYIVILYLSLSVIAGIGFEAFIREENSRGIGKSLAILAVVLATGLAVFYFARLHFLDWLAANYIPGINQMGRQILMQNYLPGILREYYKGMMFLGVFILIWLARKKINRIIYQSILVILVFANISFINQIMDPLVKTEFYSFRSPTIDFLSANLHYDRYYFEKETRTAIFLRDLLGTKMPLLSNMGMNYHLFDAMIYESVDLAKEENILRVIASQPSFDSTPFAAMLGIRYFFSQRQINEPNLQFLGQAKTFNLYKNNSCLPRALVVPGMIVKNGEDLDIVNYLVSREFDPRAEVVISGAKDLSPAETLNRPVAESARPAEIMSYDVNEVTVSATAEQPSWLVLFDQNYPGWQADVNGQRASIYDANYLFRAVKLPPGTSTVRFKYIPTYFVPSLAIFLFILMGGTVLLTAKVVKR